MSRLTVVVLVAALPALASASRRSPVVRAVERAAPAVVGIQTQVLVAASRRRDLFDWFFQDLYSGPKRRETLSQGSGVVIDPTGYVLTNYHVIAQGHDVEVQRVDGSLLPAEVVGTAPDHDLAVLKVKHDARLPHIPMAASDDLMIGETVIAIGNPFGLSHSVTTGVISALHRSIRTEERVYADFIQTDASINPGNSGGPLLTVDGRLVGINTAVHGRAQGIGFAIPIDKAKRIVTDLLRHGELRAAYYGVELQDLTPDLAQSFGLRDPRGVVVAQVDPRGPAAKVVREGDVVVAIGEVRVNGRDEARVYLGDYTVGSSVRLKLVRAGQSTTVTLRPGELSPQDAVRLAWLRLGLRVRELSRAEARRARLPERAMIIEEVARGSAGARYGLRPGDWIRAINSKKIQGTTAFGKALARSYWRGAADLLVQRGSAYQRFRFRL